jgi:hypothetical protein
MGVMHDAKPQSNFHDQAAPSLVMLCEFVQGSAMVKEPLEVVWLLWNTSGAMERGARH